MINVYVAWGVVGKPLSIAGILDNDCRILCTTLFFVITEAKIQIFSLTIQVLFIRQLPLTFFTTFVAET